MNLLVILDSASSRASTASTYATDADLSDTRSMSPDVIVDKSSSRRGANNCLVHDCPLHKSGVSSSSCFQSLVTPGVWPERQLQENEIPDDLRDFGLTCFPCAACWARQKSEAASMAKMGREYWERMGVYSGLYQKPPARQPGGIYERCGHVNRDAYAGAPTTLSRAATRTPDSPTRNESDYSDITTNDDDMSQCGEMASPDSVWQSHSSPSPDPSSRSSSRANGGRSRRSRRSPDMA